MDELPAVLLGLQTTWKEDLDVASLTYGTNLQVPGDFLLSPSADKLISTSPGTPRELTEAGSSASCTCMCPAICSLLNKSRGLW